MNKNILKVYFDSDPIYDQEKEKLFQKIIGLLNKNNCNVVQTIIGVDLGFIDFYGKKAADNLFASKIKDIVDNDIFICEISTITPMLSFEIFEALNLKKPVLALYQESPSYIPDISLLGNPSPLLTLTNYNYDNLEPKIIEFIKKAGNQIPIDRFTVRLSKDLGTYLDHLKTKMDCSSKNEVIIKIIEKFKNEEGF